MSYDCADFQSDIFGAFQAAGLIARGADPEGPSETADLVLAAFDKLIAERRLTSFAAPVSNIAAARRALDKLIEARELLRRVGAVRTLAKVRSAISSAKGAVRAVRYREDRTLGGLS